MSFATTFKPGRFIAAVLGTGVGLMGLVGPGAANAEEEMRLRGSSAVLSKKDLPQLRNIPVFTAEGEEIGHVGDVYYDETSDRVECVGVPGDTLGFKNVMVPVAGAQITSEGLQLPYRKDQLRDFGDTSEELDGSRWEKERGYYEGYDDDRSAATAQDGDASLTRSEEEIRVGTEKVESGQVRLRKYVETEPVEAEVELKRETINVERHPIDRQVTGADFEEKEIEVSLHEERPVVEKQAVAKEEVSLTTDVETDRRTIRDDVRKERIEVEDEQQ